MYMDKEPKITKCKPGYAIGYVPNEPWISPLENTSILDDDILEEDDEDLKKLDNRKSKSKKKKFKEKKSRVTEEPTIIPVTFYPNNQAWVCPKCARIYGPITAECATCNREKS